MPRTHVVEHGEHIATIADQAGFAAVETIWDDPANAELCARRDNPYLLSAGDEVVIPDRVERRAPAATGNRHFFVVTEQPLLLRVRLLGLSEQPAGDVEILVDDEPLRTDADGFMERRISPRLRRATFSLDEGARYALDVGGLDPVEELSGVQARLNNLGYDAGDPGDGDEEQIAFAVSLFQRDHGLSVDGRITDALTFELRSRHGC